MTSWGSGLDHNRTKYVLKSQALPVYAVQLARENGKVRVSVGLTMKSVLSSNSSRSNSSVDDVPSQ